MVIRSWGTRTGPPCVGRTCCAPAMDAVRERPIVMIMTIRFMEPLGIPTSLNIEYREIEDLKK